MRLPHLLTLTGALLFACLGVQALRPVVVQPVFSIAGSVADEKKLLEVASPIITDMPALRALWASWKVAEALPVVDFAKQIVRVSTTRGSALTQGFTLDAQGNLTVEVTMTKDLQPGFRYIIAGINRTGISTIDGKALPEERVVEPISQFTGAVNDEELLEKTPLFIADAPTLAALWARWTIADKLPAVDFTKQLVVIQTTRGSIITPFYALTNSGQLRVNASATKDLRPGFRYVIAVMSREGVVQVNDQKLPACADCRYERPETE